MAPRLVFVGPPGSGKGTYAKHVCRVLGVPHVSTGDLLRAQVATGTALGRAAAGRTARGELLPDALLMDVMRPVLDHHARGWVLDGFPRTLRQAELLLDACSVDRVVAITMREDVLVRKSVARRVCAECGGSFNLANVDEPGFSMPAVLPTDPACAARRCIDRFEQRADDTAEVVRERLRVFHRETGPVVDFFAGLARTSPTAPSFHPVDIQGGFDRMAPVFEEACGVPPGAQDAPRQI